MLTQVQQKQSHCDLCTRFENRGSIDDPTMPRFTITCSSSSNSELQKSIAMSVLAHLAPMAAYHIPPLPRQTHLLPRLLHPGIVGTLKQDHSYLTRLQ